MVPYFLRNVLLALVDKTDQIYKDFGTSQKENFWYHIIFGYYRFDVTLLFTNNTSESFTSFAQNVFSSLLLWIYGKIDGCCPVWHGFETFDNIRKNSIDFFSKFEHKRMLRSFFIRFLLKMIHYYYFVFGC